MVGRALTPRDSRRTPMLDGLTRTTHDDDDMAAIAAALGSAIPPLTAHAIFVSLPDLAKQITLADEEGEKRVVDAMVTVILGSLSSERPKGVLPPSRVWSS